MCHLPVLWLQLVLTVFITNRCAIGLPTRSQLQQLINTILFEDKLNNDILSERVILEKNDDLPVSEAVKDLNNVDPLVSLLALHTTHPYHSGENLNLSMTIVRKSLVCLTHKRVAFHLTLIIGLFEKFENRELEDQVGIRLLMFLKVIPFNIDILSSIYGSFDKLLNVYNLVTGFSDIYDKKQEIVNMLTEQLTNLNNVIKSSCVDNEIKQYCSSLKLTNLENCEDKINDENKINLNLDINTITATLIENENAILNYFEEMDLFRNVPMSTWNIFLKTPELPPASDEEKAFVRKPLPVHPYRDEIEAILAEREKYIENENDFIESKSKTSVDSAIEVEKKEKPINVD